MSLGDYFSHYPVLAAAVVAGRGPVLELGCGYGSTLMLHYMCKAMEVPLMTMDTDKAWLERFAGYAGPGHQLLHVEDWAKVDFSRELPARYGCVFVDCAPGNARIELILRLKMQAKFIVAHDSERDHGTGANYEYERADGQFNYITEFRRARPYTKILSHFQKFEIEKCDQVWEHGNP